MVTDVPSLLETDLMLENSDMILKLLRSVLTYQFQYPYQCSVSQEAKDHSAVI
jgi:hypothetical protein